MPSAISTLPGVKLQHLTIPVPVPEGATEQEAAALTAAALYKAYAVAARRAGLVPEPVQPCESAAAPVVRPSYPAGPPSPRRCRTAKQFLDRMRALKRWAGLSFAELEAKARERGEVLPHSSIARILAPSNTTRLPNKDQLTAFVLACGLSDAQWRDWATACEDIQSTGDRPAWPALDGFDIKVQKLGDSMADLKLSNLDTDIVVHLTSNQSLPSAATGGWAAKDRRTLTSFFRECAYSAGAPHLEAQAA